MSFVKNITVAGFVCVVSIFLNEAVFKARLPENLSKVISRTMASIRYTDLDSFGFAHVVIVVLVATVGVVIYRVYVLLFRPLDRVRLLGDIGYQPDGKFSLKEISELVRKRRAAGDIPPVYPNGWYAILESWRLKKGETKTMHLLGQEMAVFRDVEGEAHVLDAYCPHLGANLAVGGRVVRDCIQCPFHGWKFRGHDGKCIEIPYADKIPDIAKVKSWRTVEINDWINIWYHAEGLEPNWSLPEIDCITNGTFRYKGRTEHHISAHIQEIPENGADAAHLNRVHQPFLAAGYDLHTMWNKYIRWGKHHWEASWSSKPNPDGHIGCMTVTHDLKLFGYSLLNLFKINVTALQYGPAIVYITMEGVLFKCVLIHVVTPMEPMVQKVVQTIYVHWAMPNIIAKIFLAGDGIQVDRDVSIWNNKKFLAKPVFTKSVEDGYLARFRRWYSQFYSEHSPRLKFQKDTLDW